MNHNDRPLRMNYSLNKTVPGQTTGTWNALRQLWPLFIKEKNNFIIAMIAVFFNTGSALLAPMLIGYIVDHYFQAHDYRRMSIAAVVLFLLYVVALIGSHTQTIRMGTVGRRVLYNLRNDIFSKLQELPVAFFNQNKVGDLISRINNDTDRLNQFFSQALILFVNNFFLIVGAMFFLLSLNVRLGAVAVIPGVVVLVLSQILSPWVKQKNADSLKTLGILSAEIQESLENFKVIVAFNRNDYFRKKFEEVNEQNYRTTLKANIINSLFVPLYFFASTAGQFIVLVYGVYLIHAGQITVGLLISFFLYINNFYTPLRQLANQWSSLQQSLAAVDRIMEVLRLSTTIVTIPEEQKRTIAKKQTMVSFRNVSFHYTDGVNVLNRINFELKKGKTYALVGPTGGGKTTTASLMARLYDPTEGVVELDGRDIRTYTPEERSKKIGFILQEPFLFTGTLLENIFYGHPDFAHVSKEHKLQALKDSGMQELLEYFQDGLEREVRTGGETISLGQRQLIAFVRAVLRKPELLILDEATANVDTVTEQLLDRVLEKLPPETTKVIIAHRLNTIENADEIYFVNDGTLKSAGSVEHALKMLMHGTRST